MSDADSSDSNPGVLRGRTDSGEPRRRVNWADRVPLVTLLGALAATCVAAGGAWAQLAALSSQLDRYAAEQRTDHDRITRLEVIAAFRSSAP